MTTFRAVIALAIAGLCESVSAADTPRTQVMLVGTYHFANPGEDIHNVKAVCLREQPAVQLVDPLSYLAGT